MQRADSGSGKEAVLQSQPFHGTKKVVQEARRLIAERRLEDRDGRTLGRK